MNQKCQKRATMKDVAQRSGVTIGTVSHVINGTAPISAETMEKVVQAIDELDYTINPMARYMRSKKSYNVGLLIPNLNNSFYSMLSSAFVDEAYKCGYNVSMLSYEYSKEREKKELYALQNSSVDAIVIVNGYDDEEYIRDITDRGTRIILADRRSALADIPYVQFDNTKVLYEIVAMLKEKGYGTIGYISESMAFINIQDRYKAFTHAMDYYGYQLDTRHVYISDSFQLNNMRNGYLYMKQLLESERRENLPDAFIASSDQLAIGVIRALAEKGYSVPGDMGIVGCDNIEVSGYILPRLTTINQDQTLLGKKTWEMVCESINGKTIDNINLDQKLIIRGSC